MSKNSVSKQEMLQLRRAFVIFYPNCFVPSGATKRPLKIGIKKDMLDRARKDFPGLSHRHIRAFLTDYTSGLHYFQCCREGSARVDLDGNFTGFVTAQDAEFAERCIALIKKGGSALRSRFPKGEKSVADLVARSIPDVLSMSYEEWAAQQRELQVSVLATEAYDELSRYAAQQVATAFGVPAQHLETLEGKLKRLEAAQYAASMSNNRYYTDGSKARDDAEIAEVRRQIAQQFQSA